MLWQRARNGAAPFVVLSITAVLVVHKLLSCLPYRATPGAAQTSRGVPLVSLLYTSKQSAEHITTWRELEIIAGQTSTACLCFVLWYLSPRIHLVVEAETGERQAKVGQTLSSPSGFVLVVFDINDGAEQTYVFWKEARVQ